MGRNGGQKTQPSKVLPESLGNARGRQLNKKNLIEKTENEEDDHQDSEISAFSKIMEHAPGFGGDNKSSRNLIISEKRTGTGLNVNE